MRLLYNARNASVGTEDGMIVEPTGSFDLVIDLPAADVRPGLINAHDHLHRNHYGRLGEPPYRNAAQWAQHIQRRYRRRIARRHRWPRRAALLAGAWKNLFAGVTTVVHHDRWETDFDRDFPIRVAGIPSADSVRASTELDRIQTNRPYCIHVAEGTDPDSADEVRNLHDRGLLTSRLIAVHGVGCDDDGIARLRASGAALAWCPTSNLFMLGRTAAPTLLRSGIDILLGSDSLLSGEGDLLCELRFARAQGVLDDGLLEEAVGDAPARRLGLPLPSLRPGAAADLIFVRKPILEAGAEDVDLVVVEGAPRVARVDLVPRLGAIGESGEQMKVGSVLRWATMRPARFMKGRPA